MVPQESQNQSTISRITRKKIIKTYQSFVWAGDLNEVEFLSRLYMLNALPSTDSRYPDAEGDIYQHRINHHDWDDEWVFTDERFNLNNCSDDLFLRFLAETLHPEVREDPDEIERLAQELNQHLYRDGWELVPVESISGYPIYGGRRCEKPSSTAPTGFPLVLSSATASVAEVLKNQGHARELAVLAHSQFRVEQTSYDSWNGGTRGWGLTCTLEASLYARLSKDEREACEKIIQDAMQDLFRPFDNDHLDRVILTPRADGSEDWQADALRWLSGEGVNNQGRVRSDNVAALTCDGLLFRSEPEIHLYRALKQAGVTFAPLPVFLRGGEAYARLEPDFVVLVYGRVFVIEVDGDTYHRESPADAHRRLQPLDHEGAKIERVKAEECSTPEKAQQCVQRLLKIMERLAKHR
jgi:hypothetical protein